MVGFGLGAFVAAQVGPMSLFLIRSTLRAGFVVGLAIGFGIATIDAAYAALGGLGAASVVSYSPVRLVGGLLGATVLMVMAVRTLMAAVRVRNGFEIPADLATPGRAWRSALAGTASNPVTIASWAAIFAATTTVVGAPLMPLVVGVGLGSLTWVVALAAVVAVLRPVMGPRSMAAADGLAGVGLLGYAGVLGYKTVRSA
jgi:putative LysE/RhtB family amino acid efflux pump